MGAIKSILLHRNTILVIAVIAGLIFGDNAVYIKNYTIYLLAIVMTFATTGIQTKALWPLSKVAKPLIMGAFLNYIVFGLVMIFCAWLLMPDEMLFYGFVIVAAAPPGVAVIPFTYMLKGNLNYAIVGTLGAFIGSVFMAPLFVRFFANSDGVDPFQLFILMVKLVVVPLLISRLLLHKKIFPVVEKSRGQIVDWGFALIIFTAVGINRHVFFSEFKTLLLVSSVMIFCTFVLGEIFIRLSKKLKTPSETIKAQTMLVTVKSSGFSVVTAMSLFGEKAAIPSAVLAIMVLAYFLFISLRTKVFER